MDRLSEFRDIAPYLANQLIFVGFVLSLMFGIFNALLKAGILKPITGQQSFQVVKLVLKYGFYLALIAILGGFLLRHAVDSSTFPFTVFVHGPLGTQDIVLRNSGEVFVDLGGERRHILIGDQGQAYFPAIPANFRGREVPVWVESDKFESIDPGRKVKLDGPSIYLAVRRKAGRIHGRIESVGSGCLSQAQVHVGALSTVVDPSSGQFEPSIPGDHMEDDLELQATAPGCMSGKYKVVPNSNNVVITLQKSRNP